MTRWTLDIHVFCLPHVTLRHVCLCVSLDLSACLFVRFACLPVCFSASVAFALSLGLVGSLSVTRRPPRSAAGDYAVTTTRQALRRLTHTDSCSHPRAVTSHRFRDGTPSTRAHVPHPETQSFAPSSTHGRLTATIFSSSTSSVATLRVARLTLQTRKLRLVSGVATDRDALLACPYVRSLSKTKKKTNK